MSRHDERLLDVGPYLLGTLAETEGRDFERHLLGCATCRAEVERLRPAAEALPRSVEPLSPPPGLKRALMDAVEGERDHPGREEVDVQPATGLPAHVESVRPARRRPRVLARFVPALSGGLALVGVGLAVGYALSGRPAAPEERTIEAAVDRLEAPGAEARLVVPVGGPDVPTLTVRGLPRLHERRVYEVWLKRGGALVPQSLFEVSSDGSGTAGIPDGLDGVEAVMVTRERAGGARAPTGEPLLTVRTE